MTRIVAKTTEHLFDAIKVVDVYRQIIARRGAATTDSFRNHYDGFARTLRHRWKEWQGEDSLHEMAFGESIE